MNTHPPDPLTEKIIGSIYEVANTLGPGFLEKVYERALLRELTLQNIPAKKQVTYSVIYKGQSVGDYFADIVASNAVVIEIKCVDRLSNDHKAQCINYLKASGLAICLLVNFQQARVEIRRIVSGFEEPSPIV